jgi:hypothetical protein
MGGISLALAAALEMFDVLCSSASATESISALLVGRAFFLVVAGVLLTARMFDGFFGVGLFHGIAPLSGR